MDGATARATSEHLALEPAVAATLRERLPDVAAATVAAVTAEVPSYAGAFTGDLGATITGAVQVALGGFLKLATRTAGSDPGTPLTPALEAAYDLGRGEARSGRSMDALQAAYRIGARVAWREMSAAAAGAGMPAGTMARFAELVFAYIDELSASSVAGHTDELATSGRVRERYLERLAQLLLAGADEGTVMSAAARAGWQPPATLTAVLLPEGQVHALVPALPAGSVLARQDLPGVSDDDDLVLLLVPDLGGRRRTRLLRMLAGRDAVVGPARPWLEVAASYARVRRTREITTIRGVVDTDEHLAEIVLGADAEALADLRTRVLAPLAGVRASSRERLAETLRSWLLHQGRRDDVAADLFVHAQTVRYRMGQVRELYGDALDDPRTVLELTLALGLTPQAGAAG
ncbi:PucR family transcriptional regulator [Longivirga aurantiaca]|uniref:PucR family transcriptional regulator n=1 Tax=Longivirga aurantiaca TaxID=1837743 RepID=A0ABW1T181_9ACTN